MYVVSLLRWYDEDCLGLLDSLPFRMHLHSFRIRCNYFRSVSKSLGLRMCSRILRIHRMFRHILLHIRRTTLLSNTANYNSLQWMQSLKQSIYLVMLVHWNWTWNCCSKRWSLLVVLDALLSTKKRHLDFAPAELLPPPGMRRVLVH